MTSTRGPLAGGNSDLIRAPRRAPYSMRRDLNSIPSSDNREFAATCFVIGCIAMPWFILLIIIAGLKLAEGSL